MRIDAMVINASPLITLFRGGQADLLPHWTPTGVQLVPPFHSWHPTAR